MQLTTNPLFGSCKIQHKTILFAGDDNRRRLYQPIRRSGDDQFERQGANSDLYPSMEMPAASTLDQPSPAAHTSNIENASLMLLPKISKSEFLTCEMKKLEQANPAISMELAQRKFNVQNVLNFTMSSAANLVAISTTHGWGAVFLPMINVVSAKVSAWAAHKVNDTIVGKAIDGVYNFAKRGFEKAMGWLFGSDQNQSVRFGGSTTKTKATTLQHQKTLTSQILGALQSFREKLNNSYRTETRSQMATELFGNMFASMQEFIAQGGSSTSKAKMELLSKINTDVQAISQELPSTAKAFNDIPLPTRQKMLSVIYDALTSDMPQMIQWGESVGQELGISKERMNQLKGITKNVR